MSVLATIVFGSGNLSHSILVSNINNSKGIFIVTEAHFPSFVPGIRSIINDALGVVNVTVITVTSRELRLDRITNVDDVQSSSAGFRSDRIGKTGFLINRKIVRRSELGVKGSVLKRRSFEHESPLNCFKSKICMP